MDRSRASTKVWHIPPPINFLSRTRSPHGTRPTVGQSLSDRNTSADFDLDHAADSWMNRGADGWQSYLINTMMDTLEHEMDVVLLRATVVCSLSSEKSSISFLFS